MSIEQSIPIKSLFFITLIALSISVRAEQDERHDERRDKKREQKQEQKFEIKPSPRHEQRQELRREKKHKGLRRERDIRRFDHHEFGVWRAGRWRHVRHEGRLGWWWVVGGVWYFYPQPIYPYPNPYIPHAVVIEKSAEDIDSAEPPPAQNWYFCVSADGYYPYVPSCPEGWKVVPATPPDLVSTPPENSSSQPPAIPQW